VPQTESDADVLAHVSRRLFAESREEFRAAHEKWMKGFETLTTDEFLRLFGEAIEQERRAFEKQREAVELRRAAFDLRAKRWAELKEGRGR